MFVCVCMYVYKKNLSYIIKKYVCIYNYIYVHTIHYIEVALIFRHTQLLRVIGLGLHCPHRKIRASH